MRIKCPYCKSSNIFKERKFCVPKGWSITPIMIYIKKCRKCGKPFRIKYIVGKKKAVVMKSG
jgi:DNA-directed RNA polymerase subunit RPC12/RpoP